MNIHSCPPVGSAHFDACTGPAIDIAMRKLLNMRRQRGVVARRHPKPLDERVHVARSPTHGRGLFASRPIRKGAILGRFEGVPTRRNGPHVLWVENEAGAWEGRRGTNLLRFVNHADRPNAQFRGWDLVALRNIRTSEEITVHYDAAP